MAAGESTGEDAYPYDIAVSFAGEHRAYVAEFVAECRRLGYSVFYDRDMAAEMWGRNFVVEFRAVYGGTWARCLAVFISPEYLRKAYPIDELRAAIAQHQERGGRYIVPIIIEKGVVPAELHGVGSLDADSSTAVELAAAVAQRLRDWGRQPPRPL